MITKSYYQIIKSKKHIFLLLSILSIALFFRTIGFNWDQNQHLHPDERFLTMVLTTIKIPNSLGQYLDPKISTLNPYNNSFSFFVYGSFPLNSVKILGNLLNKTDYNQINLVGRSLTILADVLVVLLIYLICVNIFNIKIALLASFLYSICVFPIQLAHFYTVDPFLNLFIILCFYLLILLKNKTNLIKKIFLLSLSFGTALACKISAIYFLPIIGIFFLFYFYKKPKLLFLFGLTFLLLTLVFFRLNQPQVFSSGNILNWNINPQFIDNLKELQSYNQIYLYPPGIQWLKTIPLLFPLKNIIFWGAGLPLGTVFLFSIFYSIYYLFKKPIKNNFYLMAILSWIFILFFYQGSRHVTTMRYFLSIYPFFCIVSAFVISRFKLFRHGFFAFLFLVILLIYPISFISIYLKDNSRITASNWIYKNIPVSSTIATEYWDDQLPLFVDGQNAYNYNYESLAVASLDDSQKINKIKEQLMKSDYIILSSNRFHLPISQNKEIFPQTANYYQSLFDGSLGFKQVAEFNSYPCFPPIGKAFFCLNDTSAEEAFTVYDHPKVYIFQKTQNFNLNSF